MTNLSYDQAITALRHKDLTSRRSAVIALGALGDTRAVPDLTSLLADPHWQVRYHAAETLGKLADGRAFDGLSDALDDGVDWVRFMALQSLARLPWAKGSSGKLGGKLIQLTASANPILAKSANQALDRLVATEGSHPFQQPEAMLALLAETDTKFRLLAIDKLPRLSDPRVEPALIKALGDGKAKVREAAVNALGEIGGSPSVEALFSCHIRDQDESVRLAAERALGAVSRRLGIDPYRDVDLMVALLVDNEVRIRLLAIDKLQSITDPRVEPALITALGDGEAKVREAAVKALGEIGGSQSVEAVFSCYIRDQVESVRQVAERALGAVSRRLGIDPYRDVELMLALLAYNDVRIRLLAIDKLQRLSDPRVEPALITALGDGEARVRLAAALALAEMGTFAAVSSLVPLFVAENDHSVKQAAASALEAIGKRLGRHPFEQAEVMVEAARHDNPAVRRFALEKLAGIKELAAYRALVEALGADGAGGDLQDLAIAGLVAHGEAAALLKLHPLLEQERKRDKKSPLAQKLSQAVDALKAPAKASLALPAKGVYCRDCFRRFDTWTIKTGLLSKITFAGCFTCGLTANRLEGITTVVAIIAEPWPEPTRLDGDTLSINMAMRDRKNYMVDFERLEVHEAPTINLDDEIQLLLRRSAEDYSMNPTKMKTIPVQLIGKPKINMNSINLLRFKMEAEFKGPVQGADGRLMMEE